MINPHIQDVRSENRLGSLGVSLKFPHNNQVTENKSHVLWGNRSDHDFDDAKKITLED